MHVAGSAAVVAGEADVGALVVSAPDAAEHGADVDVGTRDKHEGGADAPGPMLGTCTPTGTCFGVALLSTVKTFLALLRGSKKVPTQAQVPRSGAEAWWLFGSDGPVGPSDRESERPD